MKEHQLQNGTYCVPKDKEQCLEILKLADSKGLVYGGGYTERVLIDKEEWPLGRNEVPKAVSYADAVYAFALSNETEITVDEFIARLKGEWNEGVNHQNGGINVDDGATDTKNEGVNGGNRATGGKNGGINHQNGGIKQQVTNPPHYTQMGMEPWEFFRKYKGQFETTHEAALAFQIIQYILRAPFKKQYRSDIVKAFDLMREWVTFKGYLD